MLFFSLSLSLSPSRFLFDRFILLFPHRYTSLPSSPPFSFLLFFPLCSLSLIFLILFLFRLLTSSSSYRLFVLSSLFFSFLLFFSASSLPHSYLLLFSLILFTLIFPPLLSSSPSFPFTFSFLALHQLPFSLSHVLHPLSLTLSI